MRKLIICFSLLFLFFNTHSTFAESSYVLPYPGAMPGTLFHKLHSVLEVIEKYWYFGDFAQFDFNLKESDHYLVEAKTLFEYKQYLLATKALEKSNQYFKKVFPQLLNAQIHKKNIQEKKTIYLQATQKHIETLEALKKDTPKDFFWNPEKGKGQPQNLAIERLLDLAIRMRRGKL